MPKNEEIIIRLKPLPNGSAKAVVSLCSAELFVLHNKTISSLKKVEGVFFNIKFVNK